MEKEEWKNLQMKEFIQKQNPSMLEYHVVKEVIFAAQVIEKPGSENMKQTTEKTQIKAFASVIKLVEENDGLKMEDIMQH